MRVRLDLPYETVDTPEFSIREVMGVADALGWTVEVDKDITSRSLCYLFSFDHGRVTDVVYDGAYMDAHVEREAVEVQEIGRATTAQVTVRTSYTFFIRDTDISGNTITECLVQYQARMTELSYPINTTPVLEANKTEKGEATLFKAVRAPLRPRRKITLGE